MRAARGFRNMPILDTSKREWGLDRVIFYAIEIRYFFFYVIRRFVFFGFFIESFDLFCSYDLKVY